jgi:hypothetical protein
VKPEAAQQEEEASQYDCAAEEGCEVGFSERTGRERRTETAGSSNPFPKRRRVR